MTIKTKPQPIKVSDIKQVNLVVGFSTPYTNKIILKSTQIHSSSVVFDYCSLTKDGHAGELRFESKGVYKVNSIFDDDKVSWSNSI